MIYDPTAGRSANRYYFNACKGYFAAATTFPMMPPSPKYDWIDQCWATVWQIALNLLDERQSTITV
jgi:hypothetical protein